MCAGRGGLASRSICSNREFGTDDHELCQMNDGPASLLEICRGDKARMGRRVVANGCSITKCGPDQNTKQ
jgi:hypothetical protein